MLLYKEMQEKSITSRAIDLDKDHETLLKWWKGYSWPAVPKDALPQNGIMIEDLCAGFIYKTDSSIAWIEWIIGNPEASPQERRNALEALIPELVRKAREMGFKSIFGALKAGQSLHLEKIYEANGLPVSDVFMTHYLGRVG